MEKKALVFMQNRNDRFRTATLLRKLNIKAESNHFSGAGFRGYNLAQFDLIILDDAAASFYVNQYQGKKSNSVILLSHSLDENRFIDYSYHTMKQGILIPFFLPLNNNNLANCLSFAATEIDKIREWREFILDQKAPTVLHQDFLIALCLNPAASALTKLALLRFSQSSEIAADNSITRKNIDELEKCYPMSPLRAAFTSQAYYRAGNREKAFENSKRIFIKTRSPHFFRVTFGLCKEDFNKTQKLDLIKDFLSEFKPQEREYDNPYYSESIEWYTGQLKVWRDLRFLVDQRLEESKLKESILPSLIPYLKRMARFVEHHYHREWVKTKIAKVYRKGLELGLHLDSKEPTLLTLLMQLDQLEKTNKGLPFFAYIRNLKIKCSQFFSVYAEYCLYLGDRNEASFAILKALSYEADDLKVKKLKADWHSLHKHEESRAM